MAVVNRHKSLWPRV